MDCERFLTTISDYLEDTLDEDGRGSWRSHFAGCEDCRRRALAVEPTLVLAGARPSETSPAEVERCVAAVASLIHHDRLDRSLVRRRPRALLALAAALVVAVSAGVIWRFGPSPGAPAVGPAAAVTRPAPEVEVEMEGAELRVYHFAVDGDSDTAVALVVNPALEL